MYRYAEHSGQCRERHITYRGKLSIKLGLKVNDGPWISQDREIGNIPVMVRVSTLNETGKCKYHSYYALVKSVPPRKSVAF